MVHALYENSPVEKELYIVPKGGPFMFDILFSKLIAHVCFLVTFKCNI